MTQAEQSEMLIRIDTRTEQIEKLLNGNGQPGLLQNFNTLKQQHQLVYDRQNRCMYRQKEKKVEQKEEKKASKIDAKWLIVLIIMILAILKDFVI